MLGEQRWIVVASIRVGSLGPDPCAPARNEDQDETMFWPDSEAARHWVANRGCATLINHELLEARVRVGPQRDQTLLGQESDPWEAGGPG